MRSRPQSIWKPFVLEPSRDQGILKRAAAMQHPFPKDCLPKLRRRVIEARTKWELQRALCLLLRAMYHLPSWQIAELIGWNTQSVRRLHSRYLRDGDAVFDAPARGGRHNSLLSFQQEYILLRELQREIWPNAHVDAAAVRKAYEEAARRSVTPSIIYRMLARHGWSKAPVMKAPAGRHLRETAYFTKGLTPLDDAFTPLDDWRLTH